MLEAINKLKAMEEQALVGGGKEKAEKQHKRGKLTVRERISALVDRGTFVELNMFVEHQCIDFGMDKRKILGDGVVTGYGQVNGRLIFLYGQDKTVFGGSGGHAHGQKIIQIVKLSRRVGAPIVGLYDSAGGRIQEGISNISGYGELFFECTLSSGVVPQICAVMGTSTGGGVYCPALTDFIIQVKNTSHMFITGPEVIKTVIGEELSFEELGGAKVHSEKSGVTHFVCEDDRECLELIKRILSYLPQNNRETPQVMQTEDDLNRINNRLLEIVPESSRKIYNMLHVVSEIADNNEFLELQSEFAKNIVVGFTRLGGRSVGIVANQPMVLGGTIDIDASDKAARFIRFCDAFNIPLVSLVDNPGYFPGKRQEHGGIIRHGAKMLYAWSESTVPKIICIIRKSYGGGISAMCHKSMGGDLVFSWPIGEIALMGAEAAVRVIYKREIKSAENREEFIKGKVDEYSSKFSNPYYGASKQFIDAVIDPRRTRQKIIETLIMLENKQPEERPWKKHGNIPL